VQLVYRDPTPDNGSTTGSVHILQGCLSSNSNNYTSWMWTELQYYLVMAESVLLHGLGTRGNTSGHRWLKIHFQTLAEIFFLLSSIFLLLEAKRAVIFTFKG
jgi:hypothetical protein